MRGTIQPQHQPSHAPKPDRRDAVRLRSSQTRGSASELLFKSMDGSIIITNSSGLAVETR